MKPHHQRLFCKLAELVLARPNLGIDTTLPNLLQPWLATGPGLLDGGERRKLEFLCRVIDVRGRLPAGLNADSKVDLVGESPDLAALAALIAVLLANASMAGANSGWRFKCANTALKVLDLAPEIPDHPALLAWALECVERGMTHGVPT